MKKFVCPVCGYVHEANELPADFKWILQDTAGNLAKRSPICTNTFQNEPIKPPAS